MDEIEMDDGFGIAGKIWMLIVIIVPAFFTASNPVFAQNTDSLLREQANHFQTAGRFDSAAAIYQLLLLKDPSNSDLKVKLAQTLSWMGRLDSAISLYKDVLKVDPASYDARLGLGLTLAWKKDYGEANKILSDLAENYPRDTTVLLSTARSLSGNKHFCVQSLLSRNHDILLV